MKHAIEAPMELSEPRAGPVRWRGALIFVLIGLGLYALLYAGSEALVYRYGEKNRFFMIRTAAPANYDYVILGASRAMPLDFEDMNHELARLSGARIMNLSLEGGGVLPNRLLLDYFLSRHRTRGVVYVLDSFAFYSAQWNEQRLSDAKLLLRAPLDPAAITALWRHPWARPLLPAYVTGFAKINNRNRLEPDIPDAERNLFRRAYRPIAFLDRQRIGYLYPTNPDPATTDRYLDALRDMIRSVKDRGARFIVVKPPLPARVLNMIPGEAEFDRTLRALLDAEGVAVHDFSRVNNRDAFFYNTDHLNREGTLAFMRDHLSAILAAGLR